MGLFANVGSKAKKPGVKHDHGNQDDDYHHDAHAPKPMKRLSSRIKRAKVKVPNIFWCVLMIIKADFYDYHHAKLHEWAGTGAEVQARIGADFQNVGLLAALMMTLCVAQFMMMFDHKPFLYPEGAEDPKATNWAYLTYASILMGACIGTVTSVVFAITNMVFLNLVTEDETMIYIKHASIGTKLPLINLIVGIILWIIASIFLSYFLVDMLWGLIVSIIILVVALMVFGVMARCLQSTFIASRIIGEEDHKDLMTSSNSLGSGGELKDESAENKAGIPLAADDIDVNLSPTKDA